MWDVNANRTTTIGQHTKGIPNVHWQQDLGVLMTCSWDGSISLWDGRQSAPAMSFTFQGGVKPHHMSVAGPLMTVAASDKKVYVFSLQMVSMQNQLVPLEVG